ncbi:MAG: hypothetical protein WC822_06060 [Candidatus Paceibacterota bacterium]|jgi:hypothetical protein
MASRFPMAWHFLDYYQKEALQEARAAGLFGGGPKPAYWPQQEAGMSLVGIRAQNFVRDTLSELDRFVPDVLGGILTR